MPREITQRELRNESGDVMRPLDAGERIAVTPSGVPVGDLVPTARSRFVGRDAALRAFAHAPAIDADLFRADVDRPIDQDRHHVADAGVDER